MSHYQDLIKYVNFKIKTSQKILITSNFYKIIFIIFYVKADKSRPSLATFYEHKYSQTWLVAYQYAIKREKNCVQWKKREQAHQGEP